MVEEKIITLNVQRYQPEKGQFTTSTYRIPVKKGMTLLDALLYVRDNIDGTLTIRHSCRMGICGSCSVIANGKHLLACYTQVLDLGSDTITVTPMQNLPMIRDLVPDLKPFFDKYKPIQPYLIKPDKDMLMEAEFTQKPEELKKYWNTTLCIKCGLCYSACPVVKSNPDFPGPAATTTLYRFTIDSRDSGGEARLQHTGPWLCYYCGDCSISCPKGVEPAESIMSMRRHLITNYDWTGISRMLYNSKKASIIFTLGLALLTLLLVWFLHGPIITDRIELTTFAPIEIVHNGGIIYGLLLAALLLSNLGRMYWFTVKKRTNGKHIPLSTYFKALKHLVSEFLAQAGYSRCTPKRAWINHLILMWGYTSLFILFAILLPYTLVNTILPLSNPLRLAGYFGFTALTYATLYAIIGRVRKKEEFRKYSHHTDWMFLILLLLTSITGILIHIFIALNWPLPTYIIFAIHLAVVVPLLAEVPFGKWTHLAYRPFALYFNRLKREAGIQ